MGTRGYIGIRMNETDKGGFNHYDSYPSCLGKALLEFLNGKSKEELKHLFDEIGKKEIPEDEYPCVWDFDKNCINPDIRIYNDFLKESLWCEYAYIVNLDNNTFEFYEGFNTNPNAKGRYAHYCVDEGKKYYGVKLKRVIPLNDILNGKFEVNKEKELFVRKTMKQERSMMEK